MAYGMWMMMVLFFVWRQTNFSNFHVYTHTHTHSRTTNLLSTRSGCFYFCYCCIAHEIQCAMCVALNFLFAFSLKCTHCVQQCKRRDTRHRWDRAEKKTKCAMCPNWSVYTWGKKTKNEHAWNWEYILYQWQWMHHMAHSISSSYGKKSKPKGK